MTQILRKSLIIILAVFLFLSLDAQDKLAYKIVKGDGTDATYSNMIDDLVQYQIVMFGEEHNNAISHWLELEITKDLHDTVSLVLGAEMIEADNQDELNHYLSDSINAKALDTLARLWSNYKTDYKPLVDFAKENKLNFVATNIPRRYAKLVYKKSFNGLDSLTKEEKSWIAPLPIKFDAKIKTYKEILVMMGDHGTPELVEAQAIKDATMAHFILSNMEENTTFIHYHGCYHSDYQEGILWHIDKMNPNIKHISISTVSQDDVSVLEKQYIGKADYIIIVDSDMTTTY
ncbi:MAG: ChaN family lipoprotein [Saprospiraceae bacterium]